MGAEEPGRGPGGCGLACHLDHGGPAVVKCGLCPRMRDRADDYLRFAHDLRVPFDNNEAEHVVRTAKLRIKVSGWLDALINDRPRRPMDS